MSTVEAPKVRAESLEKPAFVRVCSTSKFWKPNPAVKLESTEMEDDMNKPRLLEITDGDTLRALKADPSDLAVPRLIDGRFVDTEEFVRWKTFSIGSGNTSGVSKDG